MNGVDTKRNRGVALLLVLWLLALVLVLLGGFVLIARTEQLEARHLEDGARARYAAEAGLSRAVYELMRPALETRWVADGRPYTLDFDDTKIEVRVHDEGGKLDINAADDKTLLAVFALVGVEQDRATHLVDAIMDWRDPDDLTHPNGAEKAEYQAAGLTYGPANMPFATIGEFQQVLGMDYELFHKLHPYITVYSRNGRPNFGLSQAMLLQLVPGVTPEQAQQLVEMRQRILPGDPAANALVLPDGTPLVAGGGSGTYTVQSLATLSNGMRSGLTAVVRLGGAPGARAYTALEWRLGSYE